MANEQEIEDAEKELEELRSMRSGVSSMQLEDELEIRISDKLETQISSKVGELNELKGGSCSFVGKGLF